MRFANHEKTALIVNEHVRLVNIPATAHRYQVNGRTPIEWFIDRYGPAEWLWRSFTYGTRPPFLRAPVPAPEQKPAM